MDKHSKEPISIMNEQQADDILQAMRDLTASNLAQNKAIQTEYTRLEHTVDRLAKSNQDSIKKLTDEMHKMTVAITKVTVESAGNKKETDLAIAMLRDDHEIIRDKQDKMDGRIYILELESAGNAGKNEANNSTKKFWSDNWYKILMTTIMVAGFFGMLYYTSSNINGTRTQTPQYTEGK